MSKFSTGLLGDFDSILPGVEKEPPEAYLKGIDKNIVLKTASYLLGLNVMNSPYRDWRKFLGMWFRHENVAFAQIIANNCNKLEIKYQTPVSLYYNIAALRFFDFSLALTETETTQDPIDSEINLFKAYLVFLTRSTDAQITNADFLHKHKDHSAIVLTLFNMQFPTADLENYDFEEVIACQMVKGTTLFQFMERNSKWTPLLQRFYSHFDISHWVEYFQGTLPLVRGIVNRTIDGWFEYNIPEDENFNRNVNFLKLLSQQQYIDEEIPDFIRLRENPLYQISNSTFRVIFALFVAEKIYKSLYFQLKSLNEELPEDQKINELRSAYGDEFTEQFLLYQVLDFVYHHRSYVRFTGQELTQKFNINGGPDYYLRNGNHLFLFENKDTFIPGTVKSSGDIEKILDDIKKKLYYTTNDKGKIKPKAVQQLAENVRRVLLKENKFDKDYKERNIQVYPILVLHDSAFNASGFNQIINDWFKIEMKKIADQGVNTDRVKPITCIYIDTLILYGEYLKRKKESLNDLITTFHKSQNLRKKEFASLNDAQEYIGSKNIPFGKFIEFHTNLGYKQLGKGLVGLAITNIFESQKC
jgi:hypothetical protein